MLLLVINAFSVLSQSGNSLYSNGRYVVVENQTFKNPNPIVYVGYDSIIYRGCTFEDRETTTDSQVIYLKSIGLAKFENCTFRNLRRIGYGDYHAINAGQAIDSLIIRDCTFENISADGLQVGQSVYDDTLNANINYVLVESSKFINPPNTSTENGIDWKGGCTDKGIINNCTFSGFKYCDTNFGCTGDNGQAIVIHYRMSRNIEITNNKFSDCHIAIAVAKGTAGGNTLIEYPPQNILVAGNIIGSDDTGIQAFEVNDIDIINNIMYDSKFGVWITRIKNVVLDHNTVVNCWYEPMVEVAASTGHTSYKNNLVVGNYSKVSMDMIGQGNIEIKDINAVKFANVNDKDYHITQNSDMVRGKAVESSVLYDIDGELRMSDGSVDIGADEFTPDDVSEPTENISPSANAGADLYAADLDRNGQENIQLEGSGSYDPDGNIVSFSWEENNSQIASGESPIVSLSNGLHKLILRVSDNDGMEDTDTFLIRVNSLPIADAGVNQTFSDDDEDGIEKVTLSGSRSSDDETIATYIWKENGTQIVSGESAEVFFTVGTHYLVLEVTDNFGELDLDSVTVVINSQSGIISNNPPTIENQEFELYEQDFTDLIIGSISASDKDNDNLILSIVSGNENGLFSIDVTEGKLLLSSDDISFQNDPIYEMRVRVTDDGEPELFSEADITVKLISFNEEQSLQLDPQSFNANYEMVLPAVLGDVSVTNFSEGQEIKFEIISGNHENLFSLNSNSGELKLQHFPKSMVPVSYDLLVRVSDVNKTELESEAVMTINIESSDMVYFIDPKTKNPQEADGSYNKPYASWSEVEWINGATYLQKSNTVANENSMLITADSVVLGSYGEGNKPVINSKSTSYAIKVMDRRNIQITNLEVNADDAIGCIYFLGSSCIDNLVLNCDLKAADYGLRIVDGQSYTVKYNKFDCDVDGIYSIAEFSEIYYNIFQNNQIAINLSSYSSGANIYNNVFYDNRQAVSVSHAEVTMYNNIFYLASLGDQAINHSLDKLVSDNNIFYPEQDGFIEINNVQYNTLEKYRQDHGLELHSFTHDPMFVDIYNSNFSVHPESKAVDGGKLVGLINDFLGRVVPSGKAPDIGMVELENPNPVVAQLADNNFDLQVYPNPSDGIFNVSYMNKAQTSTTVTIHNLSGLTVYTEEISTDGSFSTLVDISNSPSGVYYVTVKNGDGYINRKILKE